MFKRIVFLIIIILFSEAHSGERIKLHNSGGVIYYGNKGYNKQVFIIKNDTTRAITQFKSWEDIRNIYLSQDDKYLLVYHRPEKAGTCRLSLFSLDSMRMIKTTKPGHAGRYEWLKNNNILFTSGSGTNSFFFTLMDSMLNKITSGFGTCQQYYIKEGIIVAYPCMSAAEGLLFEVWSLSDGRKLISKSFIDKYGSYYCEDIEVNNGRISVYLHLNNDNIIKEILEF